MSDAPSQATLETVLAAVHDVGRTANRLDVKLNTLSAAHNVLREDFDALTKRVDGSKPPPANANGSEPLSTQAKRGSQASFDVEEIRGELLAVRSELAQQSKAMGLGVGLWRQLADLRHLKVTDVIRLATLAGVAYAAFHAAGVVK